MCYIECKCGSVRIEFPSSEPRATCECCCQDCCFRMEHTASVGGWTLPKDFSKKCKALVLNYVENNFEIVRGKDKLRFFKLRVDGDTINMSCADCSSFLMMNHPAYKGNVVSTPGGEFSVSKTDFQDKPPIIRWWVKDWPEDKVEKLDPLPGFWLEDGQPSGSEGWMEAYAMMKQVSTPVKSDGKKENFEEVLATHKGGIEVADAGLGGTTKKSRPDNPVTAAA